MAGRAYAAGGIRTTVAATRARHRRAAVRQRRSAGRRDAAAGHHHGGDQERLRPERARRGPGLAVARQFTEETTFLGAHVVPAGVRRRPGRLRRPGHRPDARGRRPARALDRRVLRARSVRRGPGADDPRRRSAPTGLQGRLHANQLGPGPGVRLACELGLTAVDHCTFLDDADVAALADSGTVATLLPGVEFSTRSPYPDARGLLDAGVTVALASDCNPGSCYTSSMPLCVALAVREMRMTPAEALWSATAGGARALGRDDVGVLAPGSAPTSPCSTPRRTSTWPTAPASRSSSRSSTRPGRHPTGGMATTSDDVSRNVIRIVA